MLFSIPRSRLRRPSRAALLLPALLILPALLSAPGQAAAKSSPRHGSAVLAFRLTDLAGKQHNLTELKKQSCTLFFFCGCTPCHECASLWSQVQRGDDLVPKAPGSGPATVVIFLGEAAAAHAFAAETHLDLSQTLLLTDPSNGAGQKFGVIQCPRVFVLGADHRLVYTNPDNDDRAPRLTTTALVSRTLTAWRHLTAPAKPVTKKRASP